MNINIDFGYLVVSDKDRSILKTEFDKLQTIDEKYNFWQDKFDLNYSLNRHDNIQEHTFEEFVIKPRDGKEIEELNKRVYNDWLEFVPWFSEKSKIAKWREDFESEIESVPNKGQYIGYEIRRIDDYVLEQNKPAKNVKGIFGGSVRMDFVASYERYLKYKQELEWGVNVCDPYRFSERLKGIECAKYREFLDSYIDKEETQSEIRGTGEHSTSKKNALTLNQQLLVLCYLGLMEAIKEFGLPNTKSAKIISAVTNGDSENIRKELSNINYKRISEARIATKENLKRILTYFEETGLTEIANRIKSDIDEVKK